MAEGGGNGPPPGPSINAVFAAVQQRLEDARNKGTKEQFQAVEAFRDVFEQFEADIKDGLAREDPGYLAIRQEYAVRRMLFVGLVQDIIDNFDRRYEPPRPLHLKRIKGVSTIELGPKGGAASERGKGGRKLMKTGASNRSEANKGSSQAPVVAVGGTTERGADKQAQGNTARDEVNQLTQQSNGQNQASEKGKQPSVRAVSTVGTLRTGGGTPLFMVAVDVNTLTPQRAQQLLALHQGGIEQFFQRVSRDASQRALDRLFEAREQAVALLQALQQWVANTDLGDDFAKVNSDIQRLTGAVADAEESLQKHGVQLGSALEKAHSGVVSVASWLFNHCEEPKKDRDKPHAIKAKSSGRPPKHPSKTFRIQEPTDESGSEWDGESAVMVPGSSSNSSSADSDGAEEIKLPSRRRKAKKSRKKQKARKNRRDTSSDSSSSMSSNNSDIDADMGKRYHNLTGRFLPRKKRLAENRPSGRTFLNIEPERVAEAMVRDNKGQLHPLQIELTMPQSLAAQQSQLGMAAWFQAEQLQKAVPVFSGKIEEFVTWRDAAIQYANSALMTPTATKLQVLKERLTGEAAELVRTITPLTPDPLQTLMDILHAEYGDKYVAANQHKRRLLVLTKPAKSNYAGWRDFYLAVKEVTNVCQKAGRSIKYDDGCIVHVLDQLPKGWYDKFIEKHKRKHCNMDNLVLFLEKRVKEERDREIWAKQKEKRDVKELQSKGKPQVQVDKPKPTTMVFATAATKGNGGASNQKEKQKGRVPAFPPVTPGNCVACDENGHALENCPTYLGMDLGTRIRLLNAFPQIHKRCLQIHEHQRCQLPWTDNPCSVDPDCRYPHHPTLHPVAEEQAVQQQDGDQQPRGQQQQRQQRGRNAYRGRRQQQGNQHRG